MNKFICSYVFVDTLRDQKCTQRLSVCIYKCLSVCLCAYICENTHIEFASHIPPFYTVCFSFSHRASRAVHGGGADASRGAPGGILQGGEVPWNPSSIPPTPCIHVYICIHTYVYVCMYVYLCVCLCKCMYVCMYIRTIHTHNRYV
jgi:hypothetical protein